MVGCKGSLSWGELFRRRTVKLAARGVFHRFRGILGYLNRSRALSAHFFIHDKSLDGGVSAAVTAPLGKRK
jgi:hypothetical protein